MAGDREVFNVEEAVDFARVSPATIRRWFDEGLKHMPTVSRVAKTGPRREIVLRSTLLAFIEARLVGRLVRDITPQPRATSARYTMPFSDTNGLMSKKPGRSQGG